MFSLLLFSLVAFAEPTYKIQIKDHKLQPAELQVQANEAFWLEVENADNTSEEIESRAMSFEKIIGPKKTAKLKVRKLSPGKYDIFGEFHMDSCQGTITAVENLSIPPAQ